MSSLLDALPSPLRDLHPYAWVAIASATYFTYWVVTFLRVRWELRGLPTISSVLPVFQMAWRTKMPNIPIISPRDRFTIDEPFKKYENAKSDMIALPEFWSLKAIYSTASPVAGQMVATKGTIFHKPLDTVRYGLTSVYGLQIVATQNGPVHRRHRGVIKGCFTEDNMEAAWNAMRTAVNVMLKEEKVRDGGILRDVPQMLIKVTLLVIGEAGFSVDIPWRIPDSHGPILPFFEALEILESNLPFVVVLPKWLLKWAPSSHLRRVFKAYESLEHHMKTWIRTRREELKIERATLGKGEKRSKADLLTSIVSSQIDAEEEATLGKNDSKTQVGLREDEVISNLFILILAGHETTGHTLTYAMGNLALYPEWQDKILAEITAQCGDEDPTYRDMNQFPLTLAFAYQTLRLRDIGMGFPRVVMKDTVLPYNTWDDQGNITQHTRAIKKGSFIQVDYPASQVNPHFWKDANTFDPTRHLAEVDGKTYVESASPTSPFLGFSAGARVCVGKRFAEVEMVSFLTYVIKHYRINPVRIREGESWNEMKKRYYAGQEIMSLTPEYSEVEFVRR